MSITPGILAYLDYRHYLADLFASRKSEQPEFSYREFSRMAGSSSPNFLQLVRDRKLNISSASIRALAQAIPLNKREEGFFETIVAFDHAKSHDEKDKHFQRILRTRDYGDVKQLEKRQYEYLSHWYMPALRELVVSADYPDDPAWIAERIIPPISTSKARKGIATLATLGLISRDDATNRWVHADRVVSTPSEVLDLAVTNHTKRIFALGTEAIERFEPSERDLRGVTLGISDECYGELKSRMESFWKELLALAEKEEKVDRVYQVNLQLFPLSRKRGAP
jgi:uncharacterized protein (TIGR02147 family)